MNCPVCKTIVLSSLVIDDAPHRLVCRQCGGGWVQAYQYWRWLQALGERRPALPPAAAADLPVADTAHAKICPECRHLLRRARVGHGITFYIERCTTCGGFWFDRNEWEVLRNHNLHDDVHYIFSTAWQHAVAHAEQQQDYERRIAAILGPEDFTRASEFKTWLAAHAHRATITAFLANLAAPASPE